MKHLTYFFVGLGSLTAIIMGTVGSVWVYQNHYDALEIGMAVAAFGVLSYLIGRIFLD